MPNIRIKDIPTTASATSSTDFIGIDGSANGTRKLNAFSPTFGGNLTVSGTGTSSVAGGLNILSNSSATGAVDIGADARASNLRLSLNAAAGNDREIITYTAGLQRWKIGVTGTAESGSNAGSNWILQAYADNGSTSLGNAISITRSTLATTLSGNLTVSGTGVSNVGGTPSTGLATHSGNLRLLSSVSGPAGVTGIELQNSQSGNGYGYKIYANYSSNDYLGIAGRFNSATWTEFVAIKQDTGNLLLGTTTDSANGKLQLATHTTSAGGIGFGTDTSLYREAAGTLSINHSGGDSRLYFYNAGTAQGRVESASSNFFVTAMAGSLILRSGGATTALTLDSSQNATFAGTGQQSFNGIIQVAKTAAGANSNLLDLYNKGTTNNTSSGIAFSANNASSAQRTSAEIRGIMTVTTAGSEESELWFSTRGAGVASGTAALKIANTGNATFAGTVTPTGGIVGVTTNSNAAAGIVGEFVSSAVVSASAVSLTNGTAANITSISLTAGDWDVTGLVQYNFTGATCSYVFHGFSTASAAFGAPNSYVQDYRNYTTASVSTHNPSLTFRISLAATTTIYFVTQADFSAGTVAAYGRIQARRVR